MADLEYAIVSSTELAAWMGLTYSSLEPAQKTVLEQIVNGTTVWLEKYCNRRLVAREDDITETFNGDGTNTYYVLNPPINGPITSITVEDAPDIDPTDTDQVRYDSETGCIYLLQQTFAVGFPLNCEIEYNGGFSTVPEDLWLAAAKIMKFVWLQRDSNKELVRAISNLAGERVEYLTEILTQDIKDVLDSYVLRRVT